MNKYINNWPNDYNNDIPVLFVKKLKELQLTDGQIKGVLKSIDEICTQCWDWPTPCSCWNDE